MPDSQDINNPFLSVDPKTAKTATQDGFKFDPSTAKPAATPEIEKAEKFNFDPSTAKKTDRGVSGHVKDFGLSLASGVNAAVDSVVGIGDMYTGGRLGKAIDDSGVYKAGEGSKYWNDKKSAQSKVVDQAFQDADGITGKAKVALSNPSKIVNAVGESIPAMLAGGTIGRAAGAATGGIIAPVAAGAIGEGAIMAGGQASQIRQQTHDGLLTPEQSGIAAATGIAGGLLGYVGGRIASKMGVADIDTALAGGALNAGVRDSAEKAAQQIKLREIPKAMVFGAISEGLLEELPQSVSEQVLQNIALEKPWHEGLDDAIVMGTLAGMAMGGAVSGYGKAKEYAVQSANSQNPPEDAFDGGNFLPAPTGGSGGEGLTGEYIPAQDVQPTQSAYQNFEYDQMPMDADNRLNSQNGNASFSPVPSQQMGINPEDGPLSAAAATAVDSGMSAQMQIEMQAQEVAEQTENNAPLQPADAARELAPEQTNGAPNTYSPEVISTLETLRQSQQGKQNEPVTTNESAQNEAAQRGNVQIDDGGQPLFEQYNTNAVPKTAARAGAAENAPQSAQLDASERESGKHTLQNTEIAGRAQINQQIEQAEQQLATGTSVPKNARMRRQLDVLKQERAQISEQDNQHDFSNSVQENVSANTAENHRIQREYGDSLESVLSDIHILSDDFTIDLHTESKKRNALSNPNYNTVQKSDGSVEIVGMRHPDTGKWIGKKAVSKNQLAGADAEAQAAIPAIQGMANEIQAMKEQLASTRSVPQKMRLQKKINELNNTRAANEAATSPQNNLPEPTQAQIEAGNYKKGHIRVHGFDITVENPRGSERRGTGPDGKEWAHTMSDHYGYIKRTIGADNEHIDTYVGSDAESDQVFIVDQMDQQTGGFDEHKVMLGYGSLEAAEKAYMSNFDKGWKLGPVRSMNMAEFRDWLKNEDTAKPAVPDKNPKDNIQNIRAEKIRQKTISDLHSGVYGSASIEQLEQSIKSLEKEVRKQHNASIGEVTNGKRSTRKAVAAGAVDRFLKNKVDLETYLKARKTGEVEQRKAAVPEETEKSNQNNSQEKKRFSRAENHAVSSTMEQVREALVSRFGEKTIADLEAQGILNIVQDQPEGMTGNIEGWYENGKVTLVASNLDADSAIATFLHELGGHGGFQNMMNKDAYADLMRQFARMVEQGNPIAVEAKRLAERELNKDVQLDEYLPYMITLASQMQLKNVAQKGAVKRFTDSLISAVKAWLYDKGIKLKLNENDILALAERMVEKQSGITATQRIQQQYQNTAQWMKALNGNPTELTEQQWLQVRTPAFKRWFGDWENSPAQASKAVDENGEPKVFYHGTAAEFSRFNRGGGLLGRGVYLTDDIETAQMYAEVKSAGSATGRIIPLFVNAKQTMQATDRTSREQIERASASGKYDGIRHSFKDVDFLVAFNSNQVKHAFNNDGSFDGQNKDIRFSRQFNAEEVLNSLSSGIKSMSFKSIKYAGFKSTDWLGIGLQALGRRQLTEIYSKILPPLSKYNELAAQMDADKNDAGANADALVREWSNLKDENQLAGLMHDATLAKIDPAKPHQAGDSIIKYKQLRNDFNALSPEAQAVYLKARDAYKKHYAKVHQAIKERILRSELNNTKKAELLKDMDNSFFGYVKGVYFPLSRFGKYVVVARSQNGQVESVSRAETMAEAEKARSEMMEKHPLWKVDRVILDKEFNASRDAVGRGFMSSLFSEVNNLGLSSSEQAEFEDTLSQLYLSSMPDLSWAKHGIHRKGTAGFSQDARRAFAQNMFSGANYLAKLRYADQMAEQLDAMQKHATEEAKTNPDYNQPKAQRVVDEMNKRHENLMNPKSHPLSSTLTSVGFIYYLGLSPASAMVNLSQTPLVAYPIMGAKWGFDKAARELLRASNDFRKGVDIHRPEWNGLKTDWYKTVSADISKFLNQDEQRAYKDAVDRGVIDVTQAHDLAGIAQGEDSGVMWKTRPVMRAASTMFHSAERFNREVTFIAAYRLARGAGEKHDKAFDQAVDATYKGHFDYSSGNRPRVMQGNAAKVLLLFKQFGQNMIYTLARQTYQSFKAETRVEKIEARKALGAVLAMHAAFAGVLGLPGVWGIMALASAWGGDDDEPWNAEIALRNYLAEAFNPTVSNLIMKGAPRALTPIDMSGRVGINNLLLPDVQEGLEGKRWAESAMAAALGPVAGIGTNIVKGAQEVSEGHNLRGIETMLPVFLRNFVKTYRYGDEGVQDKTGISIMDEVSSMDLLVQGLGFSPSDVRTANEGKSAVYQLNRKLNERRSSLMTLWSRAKMMDDQDEMGSIWDEIQAFNEKNPSRRITRMNLNQSYRSRQRRIDSAEDGIYLSRNRQDAREAGRFAFGE